MNGVVSYCFLITFLILEITLPKVIIGEIIFVSVLILFVVNRSLERSSSDFNFNFFVFSMLCWVGVHCSIYKGS
jgi:hypothetical protein